MGAEILPPFSKRNLGAHLQVDSDFPESARTGLLYLLRDLRRQKLTDWVYIVRELERIARIKPVDYDTTDEDRTGAEKLLFSLPWDKILDFCERLHNELTGASWRGYVAKELNRLFLEESLAFEFRDGRIERRGRAQTQTQVSRAQVVLGDPRLEPARKHFNKALKYFQNVSQPDPENAVKEAVCAVEATARALFPDSFGKTLGDITKSLTGSDAGQLPKPIAQTFHGLYGFRSGGEGVAHGGTSGGPVTNGIAEYAIAVAASQMILLVDLANAQDEEVPI